MNAAISLRVPPMRTRCSARNCASTSGSMSTALISALSRAVIVTGVRGGATIAFQAAEKATPADLEALHALIDECLSFPENVSLLKQNNITFHLLLAKAAGNPVFSILMESVVPLIFELSQDFSHLPSRQQHAKLHERLLSLIEQHRSAEASKLITEDILQVGERIKRFSRKSPRGAAQKRLYEGREDYVRK